MNRAFCLVEMTMTAESAIRLKAGYNWDQEGPGLTPKPAVTGGMEVLCDGAGGADLSVREAKGTTSDISASAGEGGSNTSSIAAETSGTCTTLEWRLQLCLRATLRDLNLHPHALHCRSRGGSLAAFAASRSLSRLAA